MGAGESGGEARKATKNKKKFVLREKTEKKTEKNTNITKRSE